ncbi:MAG: cadherin repeat domain-containing protein, partial [Gammaproteobacteria bacterium]|nr:cadherin repeat domain-containing protein [Gammaproteobacteria bacterium]
GSGDTDALTINGTGITGLGSDSSGAITGGHSYSYTQATGVVTITFAGSTNAASAELVLENITYGIDAADNDPSTTARTVTLNTVTDNGGGADTNTDISETATISVTAVNDTPTLAASAANDTLTENTDTASGAVFSTVTIDAIETGDDIASAQLTIAGGIENSDILTINGTAITGLGSDSSGAIAGGHSYSYTQATGVLTITFAGSTNAAAAELVLESITYGIDAADQDPSTTARTVTLNTVTDNGGGADTNTDISETATITVNAVNNAPTDITPGKTTTSVTVLNPSFEAQAFADGAGSNSITDWTTTGTHTGVWNATTGGYTDQAPDGDNIGFIDEGGTISQTLSSTFTAGQSYTLSAMVGDQKPAGDVPGWEMRLYAGGQLLGSVSNADFNPDNDEFIKATLYLDEATLSAFSAQYGQALTIEFYDDDSGDHAHFDDVKLEYTSINVAENVANGTVVTNITSTTDPDVGDTHTYTLTDDAGGRFAINAAGVITVADGSLLDYESANIHTITVRSTDAGALFYDEVVTIEVTNVNEAPTLAATAANDTLTENTDTTSAAVFSTVTIDPIETGDDIASAQLTIAGGIENTDTLTINGTAITGLGSDSSGAITGGHSYSYTQATGVVTITFAGSTNAAAAELVLENITYGIDAADQDPSTTARTVTLNTVTDNGGGSDTNIDISETATISVNATDDAIDTTTIGN